MSREHKVIDQIKSNPKAFYSYAKKFLKTTSTVGPLEKVTGGLTNDPKEMAYILQNQYKSAFSTPDPNISNQQPTNLIPEVSSLDIEFSPSDIETVIDEIGLYSANGPDGFPAMVLKRCKEILSKPLYMLWRSSLDCGTVPTALLTQTIVPIHKKDSKATPANYRPISLTSQIIKTFERVIRTHITHYLEHNSLLSMNQHGFRKGKSCLTQL